MSFKKIVLATIIGLSGISTALADIKDWTGEYSVIGADSKIINITHGPTTVSFANFLYTGSCINFAKGSSFNGHKFDNDTAFCVDANVEHFTDEVSKVGTILDKKITLGPTYTPN